MEIMEVKRYRMTAAGRILSVLRMGSLLTYPVRGMIYYLSENINARRASLLPAPVPKTLGLQVMSGKDAFGRLGRLFRLDGQQAAEVFVDAVPLAAGAAVVCLL